MSEPVDRDRETPHCPVSPSHGPPRFLFVKEGARFFRCPTCGTYLNDSKYSRGVYEERGPHAGRGETGDAVLARRGLRWGLILEEIARAVPPPGTLLDVGAGNGGFVRMARDRGYDAAGLTMSEREVDFARREFGIELARGTLEEFEGRDYAVISATSVIEHVPDPGAFLREMFWRARPGGYVAVTTPSANSYQRFLVGPERWRMIRPEHLSLFTPRGLRELAVAAGLEPLRHVTSSTTFRGLERLGPLAPAIRAVLFRSLRLTRLGGDQTLIARTPS
jgi:SAM-dependent methyltransferase